MSWGNIAPQTISLSSLGNVSLVAGSTYIIEETGGRLTVLADGKLHGDLGSMTSAQAAALQASGALASVASGTGLSLDGYERQSLGSAIIAKTSAQSNKLIGAISQSVLAGSPLQTTADTVVASLGPSAQAQATTEYATLKTNRREIVFVGPGTTIMNSDKLYHTGVAFLEQPWGSQVRLRSAPWPQSSGTPDWWNGGRLRYVVDGEGVFAVAYIRNTTNMCRILVDGKVISGADTSGAIYNAVTSSGNALQWVSLTLTGDKRRVITIDSGSGNVYSIVTDWGITISKPDYVGKAIIFGDSFETRIIGTGETAVTAKGIGATALELLGYDVIDAGTGGTGFVNDGGGQSNRKGSYGNYIDQYTQFGVALGFNPSEYGLIWLFGSGNDTGTVTSYLQYLTVIQKALSAFPGATVVVTSVYEGFNSVAQAKTMNDMLYAAVKAAGDRVKWVPVDSYYKWDKQGIWSGTGSVPNPAKDGNADVYFSNATQGASDRHPNIKGCSYGAKYYAVELIRSEIPYRLP